MVELQLEKVDTVALIEVLKNDALLAMGCIQRLWRDEEVQRKREEVLLEQMEGLRSEKDADIAAWNDSISLRNTTLKEARGQHHEVRKLSEGRRSRQSRTSRSRCQRTTDTSTKRITGIKPFATSLSGGRQRSGSQHLPQARRSFGLAPPPSPPFVS